MILHLPGLALLLLNWLGIYGLCRELAARKHIDPDWRVSWVLTCLGWGTLLTFIVELSSSRKVLNAPTLIAIWLVAGIILCGTSGSLAWRRGALTWATWAAWRKRIDFDWRNNWRMDAKLMVIVSTMLILFLGFIAVSTPTTNWDSLTYHLPRVMHWIQQQSVEHFPTGNTRQLEFAPWSAFVVTNLHLLSGNDRLDNLVQWFAMLTCVIVTTFIAQQLLRCTNTSTSNLKSLIETRNPASSPSFVTEAEYAQRATEEKAGSASQNQSGITFPGVSTQRQATALTCLLVTTLPIGLVESITTQTDYVVTCWFACLNCLILALWKNPANFWYALGVGLALALGTLSKATMFIYAAPLGLALIVCALVRLSNNRLRARLATVLAVTFVAINAPHLWRNYQVFGSPLGSRYILSIERNKTISFAGTCSNVIRNLVLEANCGIPPLTNSANKFLLWLHRFTGKGLDDPDTTYHIGSFFVQRGFLLDDSYASNFFHLLLILVAGMLALRNPQKHFLLMGYALMMAAGFLLFCTFLRWQLWHSRIHLAWLVSLAPWAGATLASLAPCWLCRVAAAVVAEFAIFCVVSNASRPVPEKSWFELPRENLYLKIRMPELNTPLAMAVSDLILAKCEHIGLKLDFDDAEYPVWVMLQNRGFTGRLSHFLVDNESAGIPSTEPAPSAVLTGITTATPALTNNFPYELDYGLVRIFWSEPTSRWAALALRGSADQYHNLPSYSSRRIPFEHGEIKLSLRSPRAGTLHLAGLIAEPTGQPVGTHKLRISTDTGFEQQLTLQSQALSAAIPSPGGVNKISLTLVDTSNQLVEPLLEKLRWRWELSGEP